MENVSQRPAPRSYAAHDAGLIISEAYADPYHHEKRAIRKL